MRDDIATRALGSDVSLADRIFMKALLTQTFGILIFAAISYFFERLLVSKEGLKQLADIAIALIPLDYFHILKNYGQPNAIRLWALEIGAITLYAVVFLTYFLKIRSIALSRESARVALSFEPIWTWPNCATVVLLMFFFFFVVFQLNGVLMASRFGFFLNSFWGFAFWIGCLSVLALSMSSGLTFLILSVWSKLSTQSKTR
jgi:hypothetical protein